MLSCAELALGPRLAEDAWELEFEEDVRAGKPGRTGG